MTLDILFHRHDLHRKRRSYWPMQTRNRFRIEQYERAKNWGEVVELCAPPASSSRPISPLNRNAK